MDEVTLAWSPEAGPVRDCGGCTACCTVLAVDELRKPMRCACPHQTATACRIYADRPAGCREFNCVWLRGGLPADEAWRPDQLGVIFDDFVRATDGVRQRTAFEIFPNAFRDATVAALLQRLVDADRWEMTLCYRDGRVATLLPDEPSALEA